ncbi:MAG: alpha-L-fucosidase [Planctomycetes bacterium]|nr:alpha-L-fucosidase [Planctomycetota bacterium]
MSVPGIALLVPLLAACSTMQQSSVAPCPPVPSARQLEWRSLERCAFAHFGVDTFTDAEWGTGTERESVFNPTEFDAKQWVRALKDSGFRGLILTAKHHDGFCLWPSKFTDHSVAKSPWKNGKGDVVREVSDACREAGLKFGVYLSPWDRHEPSYGDSPRYNQHYVDQLTELLTNYGPIFEVWWDGACGEGPNGKKQEYDWPRFRELVRKLQPNAVIFSDVGPDVRWVGNENGFAGETCWGMISPAGKVPGIGAPSEKELNEGLIDGTTWIPPECDVSIRPGWFYHSSQDAQIKSVRKLLEIWYASVGRGANLLLNVPPDRRGLFHENDVARLKEFDGALKSIFADDLARGHPLARTTDGFELDLGREVQADHLVLREDLALGQRVARFHVDRFVDGEWRELVRATTIGNQRVLRFPVSKLSRLRVVIEDARAPAQVSAPGLYLAPPAYRLPSVDELLPALQFIRRPDPGLVRTRYDGARTSLENLFESSPAGVDDVAGFEVANAGENVAFAFRGNVEVPADGAWTFFTKSDDGSRLSIDGRLVVDNDGPHGLQEQSGAIGLKAGWHALTLEWFNGSGSAGLEVEWSGPKTARTPIPNERLGR